jgi:hypothetical protein
MADDSMKVVRRLDGKRLKASLVEMAEAADLVAVTFF